MTLQEALSVIKTSMENTATAAVKVLRSSVFKVDVGEKKFEVTNLPKTQQIEGRVAVTNQQDLEKQLKVVIDWLKRVEERLKTLKPFEQVKVSNFPIPKFPDFPKEIAVSKPIDVSEKSLSAVVDAVKRLSEQISKLPTKYPEVKIPSFPRLEIPPFPEIPKPLKTVSVDNLEKLVSADPKKCVPVRLSDGKAFYRALEELSVAAGRSYAYSDSQGAKQQGLVDTDRHMQVDVVSMPTEDNSFNVNHIDEASAVITYYGKEDKGGKWLIQKASVSETVTTYTFATQTNNSTVTTYADAWAARASTLSYGTYSQAF